MDTNRLEPNKDKAPFGHCAGCGVGFRGAESVTRDQFSKPELLADGTIHLCAECGEINEMHGVKLVKMPPGTFAGMPGDLKDKLVVAKSIIVANGPKAAENVKTYEDQVRAMAARQSLR